MRIAFDGTTLRPGRTGVGYYTEHLLHHLAQEGPDEELFVLSNCRVDTTRPLPARLQIETGPWRLPRMVWMQTLAPRALRRLHPDVVHFTNGMVPLASPVPTVVTIHDMSLTLYPRYHPPRRVLLNRPLVDLAGAPRRRGHHRLAERQARHHAAVRPAARSCARDPRSRRAVVSSDRRPV